MGVKREVTVRLHGVIVLNIELIVDVISISVVRSVHGIVDALRQGGRHSGSGRRGRARTVVLCGGAYLGEGERRFLGKDDATTTCRSRARRMMSSQVISLFKRASYARTRRVITHTVRGVRNCLLYNRWQCKSVPSLMLSMRI